MPEPVKVFYSYAHKDESLRDELAKHLSPLQRRGLLYAWRDRRIPHGSEWDPEIKQHLEAAQIILLLISPDFLASDYCHLETTLALERHATGQARVIPVYLRPAAWEDAAFAKLQGLPRDARPVTEWDNPDQAFKDIAQAIRTVAQAIYRTPAGATIAYPDLAQPHRRFWRWRSAVAVLVMATALGWYGYSQYTARLAPHLAAGKRLLATGQYDLARQAYQRALAQSWFGTREGNWGWSAPVSTTQQTEHTILRSFSNALSACGSSIPTIPMPTCLKEISMLSRNSLTTTPKLRPCTNEPWHATRHWHTAISVWGWCTISWASRSRPWRCTTRLCSWCPGTSHTSIISPINMSGCRTMTGPSPHTTKHKR
jgi:hypothetical protein